MLPALPTGMQWTSGASPSTSTISNGGGLLALDAVRVDELTRPPGSRSASLLASSRQSSKLPSTWSSLRAVDQRLGELAEGDLALRDEHGAGEPGPRRVGGGAALVLPVEAQITAFAPSSTALVMAIVMPRSLNEPVGLAPSTLR